MKRDSLRLRAALPDDVAFWTEYGLPDSASGYCDGFISYYFMELNEHFAPVYDIDDRRNEREFAAPFAAVRIQICREYITTGTPVPHLQTHNSIRPRCCGIT